MIFGQIWRSSVAIWAFDLSLAVPPLSAQRTLCPSNEPDGSGIISDENVSESGTLVHTSRVEPGHGPIQ